MAISALRSAKWGVLLLLLATGCASPLLPQWGQTERRSVGTAGLRPGMYCHVETSVPSSDRQDARMDYFGTVAEVTQDEIVLKNVETAADASTGPLLGWLPGLGGDRATPRRAQLGTMRLPRSRITGVELVNPATGRTLPVDNSPAAGSAQAGG